MGVTYLLDTHVLLWLLADTDRVPGEVQATLADRACELLVSAVSALEVATKYRLGKLDAARPLVDAWAVRVGEIGASELRITSEHALIAGSMSWPHRDPFDRLLVAQATRENAVLVTTDAAILAVPALRTLSW